MFSLRKKSSQTKEFTGLVSLVLAAAAVRQVGIFSISGMLLMPRKSYNSIQGVLSSFPVLVLLYIELSCENGIPNMCPMLKERQERR